MLDASRLDAVVVGGGTVALRKVRGLLDGGVRVSVVAPRIDAAIQAIADADPRLTVVTEAYRHEHIGDAMLVIAATDDADVNARVASDARRLHRLVNVVDAPAEGTFTTPAVHRSGDLTIAVSAGRLPAAAAAVRDALASRFDDRYATAIARLRQHRERLLGAGEREKWTSVSDRVIGEQFCADVESGSLASKVDSWP